MSLLSVAALSTDARRLRRVEVSTALIGTLLLLGTNPAARRVTPLPDDAEVAFVHLDPSRDVLIVFVRSAEFDIVPEGATPPLLDLTYEWAA